MLKTFRIGGIHPPESKLSAGKKVEILPIPKQVIVPLGQSLGAPSEPVVARGDEVKVGTLLAKSAGFISSNVHSPVSGKVQKIDKVVDTSGYKRDAIIIEVIGDEWEETIDRSETLVKDCQLSSKEIIDKVAEAGIVGLGGATFPAYVKLLSAVDKTDTLIINATECEPYLTDDHALMLLKGEEILVGTTILMKAIHVERAFIGIENNKKDAIAHLSKLAQQYPGIEVVPLKTQYPQGGEKQLIDALLRRQVPSGKLPADVGCVVQNVGTAFAVYEAVQKNKPLVERIVTVTGKTLQDPCDFKVRIGTPVRHLLEARGYIREEQTVLQKVIAGGPMMGKALTNIDVPVTKGMSGVLVLPAEESVRKEARECIRCAQCVAACPMGLVPSQLMTLSEFEDWDKAESFHVYDCLECGSCSFVCPSNRPLLDHIRYGKGKVLTIIRNRK
ncbi:electron transport complex subunit RsxC [Bacteroidales bacterium OttesenSCG-928-L03]|nr:electron transport complex subunit RsxC [Bacteroidales bacterium OttesenSCG-928-L03]